MSVHGRKLIGACEAELSLCFDDARGRDAKIEILAQSGIDQLAQPVVLEHIPPGLIAERGGIRGIIRRRAAERRWNINDGDRKSTRLNSSHITKSYAVFCL